MPVVTVSRNAGSLGDELAATLAARLGYRLVDRSELVRLAGGLSGSDALERSPELRERSPSFWERLNEERRRYASVLRNVVLRLAEQENAVIVGLGAGQLLRGLHHVLRVHVVAPMDMRIERVMRLGTDGAPQQMTREQAREFVRHRDREASGYMRYLFNIDWMDPQHWDVVVNTGTLDVEQAASALVTLVEQSAQRRTAQDEARLSDLMLSSEVENALLNQASVWVSGLKVTADAGRVHIEGEVIAEEDRDVAEQVARAIPGVRTVDNDLRIQPPPLTGM